MKRHEAAATHSGGRYPWRPTCSCGWAHGCGYLTEVAALIVADEHAVIADTRRMLRRDA